MNDPIWHSDHFFDQRLLDDSMLVFWRPGARSMSDPASRPCASSVSDDELKPEQTLFCAAKILEYPAQNYHVYLTEADSCEKPVLRDLVHYFGAAQANIYLTVEIEGAHDLDFYLTLAQQACPGKIRFAITTNPGNAKLKEILVLIAYIVNHGQLAAALIPPAMGYSEKTLVTALTQFRETLPFSMVFLPPAGIIPSVPGVSTQQISQWSAAALRTFNAITTPREPESGFLPLVFRSIEAEQRGLKAKNEAGYRYASPRVLHINPNGSAFYAPCDKCGNKLLYELDTETFVSGSQILSCSACPVNYRCHLPNFLNLMDARAYGSARQARLRQPRSRAIPAPEPLEGLKTGHGGAIPETIAQQQNSKLIHEARALSSGSTSCHGTRVSVIVTCYNDGEKLPGLLDSILAQNIDGLEVIVADGGSEKPYQQILEDYRRLGLDIKYIQSRKHSYPLQSRLAGADIAAGEAIFFADCDDILIGGNALKTHVDMLINENVDIVNFRTLRIKQTARGEVRELCEDAGLGGPLEGYAIFRKYLRTRTSYPNLWSKIFSRSLCKRLINIPVVNHPNFYGAEDRLFTILAMFHARSYLYSPMVGYGYNYNDSKPLDWVPKAIGSYYLMLEELIPYLRECGCKDDDSALLTKILKLRLIYYIDIYSQKYITTEHERVEDEVVNNLLKYYPIELVLKCLIVAHPIFTLKYLKKHEPDIQNAILASLNKYTTIPLEY